MSHISILKARIRDRFATEFERKQLRSVFVIGSCAGHEERHSGTYEDFDVHFLWNDVALPRGILESFRKSLSHVCSELAGPNVTIDWCVRDRHWKILPDHSKALTIGIHATLLNALDYQRRTIHHAILGSNMFGTCEVLLGDHPGEILAPRRPSPAEFLYAAGGMSWVLENFYRALWIHFDEPEAGGDSFAQLAGYCWNVASSMMLHLYTIYTGEVSTRANTLQYALRHAESPDTLREDLRFLHQHRQHPSVDEATASRLVNACVRVSSRMVADVARRAGVKLPKEKPFSVKSVGPGNPIGTISGMEVDWRVAHTWIEPCENFYAQFREMAAAVRKQHPHPSSRELPEFIACAIVNNYDTATKLYFWTPLNVLRYLLSDDFAFVRGTPALTSVIWGWEDGVQALLQRLHERAIMVGVDDAETLRLGRVFCSVVAERIRQLGLEPPGMEPVTFEQCQQFLSECARPHAVSLSPLQSATRDALL